MLRGACRIALLFVALTVLLTYPLSLDPARRVLVPGADTDLYLWTLAWDVHAFTTRPWAIFDANIYHPQANTLAYSENLIGSALIAAPVVWVTGNPVLALNIVSLLSCALCGIGAWLLARRLGVGPAGAIVAGVVFAFSPPRFLRLSQLHLTALQWMPFALACVHSYLDRARPRDLKLAALFFSLQALSSGHGAVFLAFALSLLLTYRTLLGERPAIGRWLRDFGFVGIAIAAVALAAAVPYVQVQREMGLKRTLTDAAEWALPAVSFLASPSHLHAFLISVFTERPINAEASAFLFPGYLPLLLAAFAVLPYRRRSSETGLAYGSVWTRMALALEVLALGAAAVGVYAALVGPIRMRAGGITWLSVRNLARVWALVAGLVLVRAALVGRAPFHPRARFERWRDATRAWRERMRGNHRAFYFLLTILAAWISAGPPVGLWPAIYWLPGFNFIRVPSRFSLLAILGLAMLAGFGFDRLAASGTGRRVRMAAAIVVAFLVAEFAIVPLGTTPYDVEPPAVDRWLDTRPKPFVVAEAPIPMPQEGREEGRQALFMLHSMAHWQKTIHGYSGLRAPLHADLYRYLRDFPDEESIDRLKALGVRYVVVHTDLYVHEPWAAVEERFRRFEGSLALEHIDGAGRVYSLR